jgi:hypothetical protein
VDQKCGYRNSIGSHEPHQATPGDKEVTHSVSNPASNRRFSRLPDGRRKRVATRKRDATRRDTVAKPPKTHPNHTFHNINPFYIIIIISLTLS